MRASRPPRLVGRTQEIAELEAELRRAATGEVRCVLITADPGLGKTRLGLEVLLRNRRTATGLTAKAYPLGATASFGLWAEALERHLSALDEQTVRRLCGGVLHDLASLLRSVAAIDGAVLVREPPRLHLLEALTAIFRNLARDAPCAVFLDDLHLADASSVDALSYLARNLAGSRILLLAAARAAELAASPLVSETVLSLEQDGILRRLDLEPLNRDKVRQLAEAALDAGVAPEPLVEWLFDRSRGNPLFALGLLRSLIDEGGDFTHPELRRLPEDMTQRVMTRMRALDEPSLATLELLATFGQRVRLDELVDVSGRSLGELGLILEALLRQRLVTEDERDGGIAYEIAHPLIQETIYRSIAVARRRAMHALVARGLVAADRLAGAAPHFVRSADVGDGQAVSTVIDAFRQAEQRESHREALALLKALLALIPVGDPRWLAVLDVMTADAEWVVDHTGDIEGATGIQAMQQIEAQLKGSADLGRRGLVKLRLGIFLAFSTGDRVASEQAIREAAELFERAGEPNRAMVAANELGWIRGIAGDHATQVAVARRALAGAEEADDRVLTMQSLGSLAWASFLQGRFAEAEAALRRSAALARSEGKLYRLTWSQSMLAYSLALEGRLEEAGGLVHDARIGNPAYPDAVVLEIMVFVGWAAGRFRAATEAWRESQAWTRGLTSSRRGWAIPLAAVSMAELGDMAEAAACLARADDVSQWQFTVSMGVWASGCIAAVTNPVAALDQLGEAVTGWRAQGCLPFASIACADLAEAALDAAQPDVAAKALTAIDEMAPQCQSALERGLVEFTRGCERLSAGDVDAAADSARRAASRFGGAGAAAMQGRALDTLGRALAHSDREGARAALIGAVELFEGCKAGRRRDRSIEALNGLGQAGRLAASAHTGQRTLTPREREVVLLAVEGRTARQIGERLHIGERTVETHLANAYVKLGVDSRLELVRRARELVV